MEHAIEKLEEHAQVYVNNAKLKVYLNKFNRCVYQLLLPHTHNRIGLFIVQKIISHPTRTTHVTGGIVSKNEIHRPDS